MELAAATLNCFSAINCLVCWRVCVERYNKESILEYLVNRGVQVKLDLKNDVTGSL